MVRLHTAHWHMCFIIIIKVMVVSCYEKALIIGFIILIFNLFAQSVVLLAWGWAKFIELVWIVFDIYRFTNDEWVRTMIRISFLNLNQTFTSSIV